MSSSILFVLSCFFVSIFTSSARAAEMENLTSITWSHATNSQELLTTVLESDIQMIEADIVYGYLKGDLERLQQPIMAHPPNNESDITLRSFLTQILDFNKKNDKEKQKGVKLDFKSTDVYQNSLPLLIELWSSMSYPVWINADIYRGPLENIETNPVDAKIFFEGAKQLTNATLSTGWTTRWGSNFTVGEYTMDQVNEMINGIKQNEVKNPITFPVRAGIAAQSISQLDHLYKSLNETNYVTFTIWSSDLDSVNVDNLKKMIFHFGVDKVFIDVPDELSSKLRLDVNAGSSIKPSFMLGFAVVLGIFIAMFS